MAIVDPLPPGLIQLYVYAQSPERLVEAFAVSEYLSVAINWLENCNDASSVADVCHSGFSTSCEIRLRQSIGGRRWRRPLCDGSGFFASGAGELLLAVLDHLLSGVCLHL